MPKLLVRRIKKKKKHLLPLVGDGVLQATNVQNILRSNCSPKPPEVIYINRNEFEGASRRTKMAHNENDPTNYLTRTKQTFFPLPLTYIRIHRLEQRDSK